MAKNDGRRRFGACVPVLMRRARRVRNRTPKIPGLAPVAFVVAFMWFAFLAVSRWALPVRPIPDEEPVGVDGARRVSRPADPPDADAGAVGPSEALGGEPSLAYLPPQSAEDLRLARALDFIIRNKGGPPGPVTERMWRIVDGAALPLGVYLRDVEDRSDWHTLRADLRRAPTPMIRVAIPEERRLEQERHVRIIEFADLWRERGARLIAELSERSEDEPKLVLPDDLIESDPSGPRP